MQTFEYDRKQSKRIETNLSSDHRESKAAGRLEKTQKKKKGKKNPPSSLIEHSSAPLVHYSSRGGTVAYPATVRSGISSSGIEIEWQVVDEA